MDLEIFTSYVIAACQFSSACDTAALFVKIKEIKTIINFPNYILLRDIE